MPAGEALAQTVPVPDLLLADLPAEQNFLSPTQGRKVHQASVEILDLTTQLVNALHAARNARRLGFHLGLGLGEGLRTHATAVAAYHRLQPLPSVESSGETASMLDHSLREWPHRRK